MVIGGVLDELGEALLVVGVEFVVVMEKHDMSLCWLRIIRSGSALFFIYE